MHVVDPFLFTPEDCGDHIHIFLFLKLASKFLGLSIHTSFSVIYYNLGSSIIVILSLIEYRQVNIIALVSSLIVCLFELSM